MDGTAARVAGSSTAKAMGTFRGVPSSMMPSVSVPPRGTAGRPGSAAPRARRFAAGTVKLAGGGRIASAGP